MLRRLCCLLAAAAAAREACLRQWPPRDATPPPLFWMHAPKTGTTFRLHVVSVACPRHRRPRGRRKFEASYVRTLAREKTPCAHAYDEASLVEHRSFNTTSCGSGLALLREPRARLVSAFHYHRDGLPTGRGKPRACFLMGIRDDGDCRRLRALPEREQLLAYANDSRVRNVQTKMLLGYGRFDAVAELDVAEATRVLRECFAFVGVTERWAASVGLFNRTIRGARLRPDDAAHVANAGAYDRSNSGVAWLADYADADTRVYAEAARLVEDRLSLAPCS